MNNLPIIFVIGILYEDYSIKIVVFENNDFQKVEGVKPTHFKFSLVSS